MWISHNSIIWSAYTYLNNSKPLIWTAQLLIIIFCDCFAASMRNHITWDTIDAEHVLDVDVELNILLEVQDFFSLPKTVLEENWYIHTVVAWTSFCSIASSRSWCYFDSARHNNGVIYCRSTPSHLQCCLYQLSSNQEICKLHKVIKLINNASSLVKYLGKKITTPLLHRK